MISKFEDPDRFIAMESEMVNHEVYDINPKYSNGSSRKKKDLYNWIWRINGEVPLHFGHDSDIEILAKNLQDFMFRTTFGISNKNR